MPPVKKKTTSKPKSKDVDNSLQPLPTPKYYIEKKGQFEFVDEAYMRKMLNDLYPDWTWTVISYDLVEDKQSQKYCAVSVHGRLTVTDLNGKVRHYDSIAAHQVATLRDSGAYSDIGNDMKAANTPAIGNVFPMSKPITKLAPINPNKTPNHFFQVIFSLNKGPDKIFVNIGCKVTIKATIAAGIPIEKAYQQPPK